MFKAFRIVCCVICALILVAALYIFVYVGLAWGFVSLACAALFFGLMMLFKYLQQKQERLENPPPPVGDFITGKVPVNSEDTKKDDNKKD